MEKSLKKGQKIKCLECNTTFGTTSNLRKHVRKFHPTKLNQLAPLVYKNPSNYNFTCNTCNKNFNKKDNFHHHIRMHDDTNKLEKNDDPKKKCPICTYRNSLTKDMETHFVEEHNISLMFKEQQFSSWEEFEDWKADTENDTNSRFIKKRNRTYKTHVAINYTCHRSGYFISESKGLRSIKSQGSNKIDAFCPARIQVLKFNDGECHMSFCETHVGHDTEIAHLNLTLHERNEIAAKIALKIPLNEILDEFRESVTNSQLKRIHLLKRKDILNIKNYFNVSSFEVGQQEYSNNNESKIEHEADSFEDIIRSEIELKEVSYKNNSKSEIELKEVNKKPELVFEEEIKELKSKLLSKLNSIQSPTELETFKEVIRPLSPPLKAVERISHNAETTPQKRLIFKKKSIKRKASIKKSFAEEPQTLEFSLLM